MDNKKISNELRLKMTYIRKMNLQRNASYRFFFIKESYKILIKENTIKKKNALYEMTFITELTLEKLL